MSALPSVQLPSASTSPSTHSVCFYTFYSYIFAAIFVYIFYTHLWRHSGLYSAIATFSRPFSCTFLYTHAYLHLWTHSDASILHLHSSVDVQRSLQCYSYICTAIFVYIFVHPRLHSSVDAQRRFYSTPTLICGCTAVSIVLQLHFRGHFRVHFHTSTPTLICGRTATSTFICGRTETSTFICGRTATSTFICGRTATSTFICGRTCLCSLHSTLQRPITCLVFKVAKSAWLHFTHQTETSLFSTFYIYI